VQLAAKGGSPSGRALADRSAALHTYLTHCCSDHKMNPMKWHKSGERPPKGNANTRITWPRYELESPTVDGGGAPNVRGCKEQRAFLRQSLRASKGAYWVGGDAPGFHQTHRGMPAAICLVRGPRVIWSVALFV